LKDSRHHGKIKLEIEMNKIEQELFNRVKTHLLNQGERADSDVQNAGIYECVYHAPSGLKCAVGCLITDEAYDFSMEGEDINDDLVYNGLRDSGIDMSGKTLSILRALQHVHDSHEPSEWSESIDKVEMVY
jgi:hypothetical protein